MIDQTAKQKELPHFDSPPGIHGSKSQLAVAGFLLAVFFLQTLTASLGKSASFDEPPHIASGLSYLDTHTFKANPQHPPLLKELSALVLSLGGIHWPATPLARAVVSGSPQGANGEWKVGEQLIHDNGPDRVLFLARIPFILLGTLLGAVIYWWGCELVGSSAALGALFFYSLDPTVIAHSAIVTMDVGLTAFAIFFLFALWRYLKNPHWSRLIFCGLALGAALGAKFSAVFLLPVALLLIAISEFLPVFGTRSPKTETKRIAGIALKAALKAPPDSRCPCGSGKKYRNCHGSISASAQSASVWPRLLKAGGAFAGMCAIAALVIEALYFFRPDPFLYVDGLRKVNADHIADYQMYLHGNLAQHFYSYFAWALVLKEPIATLLASAAGLFLVWRKKSASLMVWLFLLLWPITLFTATSLLADDIGIRYIAPVLPSVYLFGGVALAALLASRNRWLKGAAGALCLWLAIEAVGIYPDHVSYFNEAACLPGSVGEIGWDGGSRCGWQWLDDSNVDWGQGLKQLRAWTELHAKGQTMNVAYFGSALPEDFPPELRSINSGILLSRPPPGLYAVSSHLKARLFAIGASMKPVPAGQWLGNQRGIIVGHSYFIYKIQ